MCWHAVACVCLDTDVQPKSVQICTRPGCSAGMQCQGTVPGCSAGMQCRDAVPGCSAGMQCRDEVPG